MIRERVAETKAGSIHYLESAPEGRPLVLFHGCFGNPNIASEADVYFSPKGFRIIAPYLPGHGPSFNLPPDFNFANLVETMADFLDRLNLRRIILYGYSLGGAVALSLSMKTKMVEKLILCDPLLKPPDKRLLKTSLCLVHDLVKDNLRRTTQKDKDGLPIKSLGCKGPQILHAKRLWHLATSVEIEPEVIRLQTPTLFLWGKADSVAPIKENRKIADKIPNRQLILFPGGHYWFQRRRLELLAMMEAFIEKGRT